MIQTVCSECQSGMFQVFMDYDDSGLHFRIYCQSCGKLEPHRYTTNGRAETIELRKVDPPQD